MTIQDILRYTSLLISTSFSRSLKYFVTNFCISYIRSDHGIEFENAEFRSFCENNDIFRNFFSSSTPQQNGIVERKNKTLQEMTRTMLCEKSLPKHFWEKIVNTTCYVQNRILIKLLIKKGSL